jgi:deoxyribose-phosphate aldolase
MKESKRGIKMNIAGLIDHTLLKPNATKSQIEKLCEEAKEHKFASVCVNPTWVKFAAEQLKGSDVMVCTVIGFPLGANTPEVKAFEVSDAIANGANEVDMVINIGALKDRNLELVERDIRAVVDASKGRAGSKVIIETSLLTDEEKVIACELSVKAGADFVKTSTGFNGGGATPADISLMRKTVGPDLGVKASGGVRNAVDAKAVIDAGATRIGASAGIAIVHGLTADSDY